MMNTTEKQLSKAIAPSKLVPGTTYTLQFGGKEQRATYEGVGMRRFNQTGPIKPFASNGFASATYGDRFIFNAEGRQVLLRKAYTKNQKSGLVFEHTVINPAAVLVDEVVKFFA